MNRIFSPHLAGALSLLLAAGVSAWSAPVRLNGSHFTTVVSRGVWGINGLELESRTNESSSPIADSLVSEAAWLNSRAEAGFLRTSSFAASDYPFHDSAAASSTAVLNFSTEATILMRLSIEVTGWGHWYFSLGSITLNDVTSGTTLWNLDWNGFSGTLPWVDDGGAEPRGTAAMTMNTEFLAGHDYQLTLYSWVSSQEPSSPRIDIEVGGIQVVPEPNVIAMVSLAGFGLMLARSRRR